MAYSEWKNAGSQVYYLGTATNTLNIANKLPTEYSNLTDSNFLIVPNGSLTYRRSIAGSNDTIINSDVKVQHTYNPSNGILTIRGFEYSCTTDQYRNGYYNLRNTANGTNYVQSKVYVVIGDIETI